MTKFREKIHSHQLYNPTCFNNLIFPIFFLILYPFNPVWLLFIFGNLIIDVGIVYLGLRKVKNISRKKVLKKAWYKVWLFGYLADFLGIALMLAILYIFTPLDTEFMNGFCMAVYYNPWRNLFALFFVLAILLFTGWLIYFFNRRFSFKNTDLPAARIRQISLLLAVLTTPYVLLIPLNLFF